MAQIGRASGARPRPVEVLCASGLLSSQLENASFMVAIALVQGPRAVLRVSSLQKPHMGNLSQRSELLLGALPSKEDRCGLSCRKLKTGSWTMVIWTRTGETSFSVASVGKNQENHILHLYLAKVIEKIGIWLHLLHLLH